MCCLGVKTSRIEYTNKNVTKEETETPLAAVKSAKQVTDLIVEIAGL